jgi:hypothetical protein
MAGTGRPPPDHALTPPAGRIHVGRVWPVYQEASLDERLIATLAV